MLPAFGGLKSGETYLSDAAFMEGPAHPSSRYGAIGRARPGGLPLARGLSEGLGRIRSPDGKEVDLTLADNLKAVADIKGADRIPLQELKSGF